MNDPTNIPDSFPRAHPSSLTELRVFISSTFQDLREEREYLTKKVFPEIRALCRERGITFTEIDLRWGLTDEEAAQGKMIRTCLEEIDRCRPYFIGITGERYGYIPKLLEYYKDPELLRRYPWVIDVGAGEISIIELEFEYAALRDPSAENCCAFFYFRQQRPRLSGTTPATLNEEREESEKLEALKKHVRTSDLSVREFRDPATLGEMVYDDLVEIIQRNFADVISPSLLEQQRRGQEAFAASRRQAYIPNPAYLDEVNLHTTSNAPPLVIYAPSGSGKSALVAYCAQQHRRRHPDGLVVEHYVGIGAGSSDHLEIIRHILMEIKDRFDLQEEIPSSPEDLQSALPTWLAYVQREPMILFIDGLNQLQGIGRELAWLPAHIPPKVRLVVTTTSDAMRDRMLERGWSTMMMGPLTREECESIVVRFLNEYRKSLSAEQRHRIASDPKCTHPLFLRTFLEELRLFGTHEGLDREIAWYLAAKDTEELFQKVLERMENDFGAQVVREVMKLLWASRNGLSEGEIADITMLSRLKLSSHLLAFDYHLVRRDGRYTFFHDYLRQAVKHRYLANESDCHETHLRLARYFATQPVSIRRVGEQPWQLQQAEAWEELKECLADSEMFLMLYKQVPYELLGYWHSLADRYDAIKTYRVMAERFASTAPDIADYILLLFELGLFFEDNGQLEAAEEFARKTLTECERSGKGDRPEIILQLTVMLSNRGNYHEAEELAREALSIYQSEGTDDDGMIRAYNKLIEVLLDRGEYTEAEKLSLEIMALHEKDISTRPGFAQSLNNLGLLFQYQGQHTQAERLYRHALELEEERLGSGHPYIGDYLYNLGTVLCESKDYSNAELFLHRAIEIFDHAYGKENLDTLLATFGLANLFFYSDRYDEAEALHRHTFEARERILGLEHPHTAQSALNLGAVLSRKGDLAGAAELYHRALQILEPLLGKNHPTVATCLNNLGKVRHKQGKLEEAESLLRRALDIYERVLGFEHSSTITSMNHLAQVLSEKGEHESAEHLLLRATEINERT